MKSKRSHKPARKSPRKAVVRSHRTRRSSSHNGLLVDVARTIGSALGTVSGQIGARVDATTGDLSNAAKSVRKSKPVAQMRVTAKKVEREMERQASSIRKRVEKLIPA